MTEERSPGEDCFDMMVEALKTEPASTPCVFSDQMGRGRTTAGMITACLIKELQITTELRSVHHGKLTGTRRTVNLAAKIRSFAKVLGLFDQFILTSTSP